MQEEGAEEEEKQKKKKKRKKKKNKEQNAPVKDKDEEVVSLHPQHLIAMLFCSAA